MLRSSHSQREEKKTWFLAALDLLLIFLIFIFSRLLLICSGLITAAATAKGGRAKQRETWILLTPPNISHIRWVSRRSFQSIDRWITIKRKPAKEHARERGRRIRMCSMMKIKLLENSSNYTRRAHITYSKARSTIMMMPARERDVFRRDVKPLDDVSWKECFVLCRTKRKKDETRTNRCVDTLLNNE